MKYIFSKTLQFGKIYEIYTPFVFLSNSVSFFFVPHTLQEMISKSFQNIPVVQCCNFSFTIQLIIMYLYIYIYEATGNGWWVGGGGDCSIQVPQSMGT